MDILHPVKALNITLHVGHAKASHAIVHQAQQPAGIQAAPLHGEPMIYGLGKIQCQIIPFCFPTNCILSKPGIFENMNCQCFIIILKA